MKIYKATNAAKVGARLGEGPVWADGCLWQVDIQGQAVYCVEFSETGQNPAIQRYPFDGMPGCIVPSTGGHWMVAQRDRLLRFDPVSASIETVRIFAEVPPDVRFNDGKADPFGRLIVGTMALDARKDGGQLYSVDTQGGVTTLLDAVTISNGLAWSADGHTLYYIDTPTQTVRAFDYGKDGQIDRPRVVVEIPKESGHPDGMTIDRAGNLWVALWGGWGVGCWDPSNGRQLAKVDVPVDRVTACTFGGPHFDRLYITTAGGPGHPSDGEAGDLFLAHPGVSGFPPASYPFTA